MTENLNQFQESPTPIAGESNSTNFVSVPAIASQDDFPDAPDSVLDEFRPTEIYRVKMRLRSIKDGILMNPKTPELLLELAKLRQKEVDDEGVQLKDRAAKKIIRNPRDGKIGIPLIYFTACLDQAGREVKSGTRKISTEKKTTIFRFLDFPDSFFPFEDQNAEWEADIRGGSGGGQRGSAKIAVAIIRPLFPVWSVIVTVDINTKECSLSVAKKLFAIAGRDVGIGDYRAKSNFGKFEITAWQTTKIS
jgi:hypothetical protein